MKNEVKLAPGWLMRVAHQAHIQCMADHDAWFFGTSPPTFKAGEEHEIFHRLDKRFKHWTGQTLTDYVRKHK